MSKASEIYERAMKTRARLEILKDDVKNAEYFLKEQLQNYRFVEV